MHIIRCDKCNSEVPVDSKTALRVYAMGKRGLMVLPLEDVVKPARDDRHFCGAWYYWTAEGPGIPPEIAERLHTTHGTVVRVEGHCGCPSPLEWRKGFAIGSYHIDSPDGLKALADTLRSIYDPEKDPDAMPYMGGKFKA